MPTCTVRMYCVTAGCPLTRLTLVGSRRPPQPIAPARVKPSREPSLSHLPRSSGLCIVGGLHRRPTRPAPASTSVTRDLLHPRSSSALSDRDHTRARAPRLLCSLVLHLSPSARSACASAWPHPGRGKRPLRWARVALSVSGCMPPWPVWPLASPSVGWGARGRKNNRRAGQVMDTPHAALPSARGVDGPGGPHLGHRTARRKKESENTRTPSRLQEETTPDNPPQVARAKREGWEDQDGTPPPHRDLNRTALHRRSAS